MQLFAKAIFLLCLSGSLCLGCSKGSSANQQPITPSPDSTDTINGYAYLALGDSYTIGQSVAPEDRFTAQAIEFLKKESIKFKPPTYIATTGWTTTNLINGIAYENPPHDYDIVTLLIGVNDQYQHQDTGDYRIRFTQVLTTAITLAAGKKNHVIVLSIPDYSVTPFVSNSDKPRVKKEINWFNAINKDVTDQNGIAYVDITPLSRVAASDASLIASDHLHFSGKEYKRWATLLAPKIRQALK